MPQADALAAAIEQALATYRDPYLALDYRSAGALEKIEVKDSQISIAIDLGYPAAGARDEIEAALRTLLQPLAGPRSLQIELHWTIVPVQAQKNLPNLTQVKNIIAVASGKGGVGKSTSAVNLALALAAEGARVGILDADIYGPSQGIMLGIAEGTRPQTQDGKYWLPLQAHGLQAMSMSFLVDDNTPMVWRGPMVSGALQQLATQTLWQDLDYLIVDMPPGTGDIQLTLAQRVPVSGAVIVTTPQDIALLDAKKGIEMFRKVDIPVIGIVENMAVHLCSQCGHAEHIFGAGGGERIAAQYGTVLLASLPLDAAIREHADSGRPTLVADPQGPIAAVYRACARKVAAQLALRARQQPQHAPRISISED